MPEIQAKCRWSSAKAMKIYLDAQAGASSALSELLASKTDLLVETAKTLPQQLRVLFGDDSFPGLEMCGNWDYAVKKKA